MRVRSRRFGVVLVLVGLFLALLAAEGLAYLALLLRPTGNPLAYATREADLNFYLASDGWNFYAIKPNHRQRFRRDEFSTTVRLNNLGFREDEDYRGQPIDVGFVGDSFTFGHGVDAGERYSDLVRRSLGNKNVSAFAYANGHAPPQYYLFLKANPHLVPRRLIIGLFPWNDLAGDIADFDLITDPTGALAQIRSKGIRVREDGFLTSAGSDLRPEPWWRRALRDFHVGRVLLLAHYRLTTPDWRPLERSSATPAAAATKEPDAVDRGTLDEHARIALEYTERLVDLVRAAHGEVIVFYIPVSYVVGDYPYFCQTISGYDAATCIALQRQNVLGEELARWAANRCLTLVDPVAPFREIERGGRQLYFAKDGHWTRRGHRAAADLVLTALAKPVSAECAPPVNR
ncbi:MAG: hypothetical protein FJX65_07565 [Alphaproteobacteria bacterium]|nr:hypothetical protein [Alphaproteobacteria bacterium]